MDTLNTPDGGHPSSLVDRQASQASTTPLLYTQPSTEDQISPDQVKLGTPSDNNNYTQAQNGDHNKIGGGDQTVEVVIDLTAGDGGKLQNGTKAAATESGRELEGEEDLSRRGTAIPIREEFHCRRFWFFYHDLRALTTSWIPQPIFVVYRTILLLYIICWLIASGVDRSPRQGAKWLIFITNHSLMLYIIGYAAITILTIVYTVIYYVDEKKLQRFYPKPATSRYSFYSQDNIAWYMKICWLLYLIGTTIEIMNVAGFWVVVYRPCSSDSAPAINMTTTTSMEPMEPCETIEVISLHVHLIFGIFILVDIFLTRVPWQFLHLFYSVSYMAFFVVFSGIYYAAGGTDHLGNPYIYSAFDYGENPATAGGFCIILLVVPIVLYICLFLLAWLRDVIYSKIGCCFRDIRSSEHRITSGGKSNGQLEPTTKVEFITKV